MSNDPLIGSVMGYFGEGQLQAFTWFRSFLLLEACVESIFLQSLFLAYFEVLHQFLLAQNEFQCRLETLNRHPSA